MNDKSNIVSNVLWKLAERMLAQIVTLVVSIVLARLLLPEDYGAISMVTVFITIANVFVVEGIPTALIQKKDANSCDFSSVFYFNVVVSVLIYALLFFFAPYIGKFYNNSLLCAVVRVMGLRIIVAAVNSVQHAYVSRHMMFRKYFWSTFFGTALSGIVGIVMAYLGSGIWALVAQYMVNTTVDTIVLFFTVDWRPTKEFDIRKVKKLINFGWKMLFEGVSNTVVGQMQNLVIGKVYTSGDLAYYTKGQQFPGLIVNNITTSIGSVLFPAIANEQDDEKKVIALLRKSARLSYYVIFPLLAGLAVVAAPFVSLVFTDKWIETVPYLQVFCLLYAPTVAMIPRHQALNGIGRSDVFMNEHIVARLVSILILLLTYKISILAILISSIFSTIIQMLIIVYTSKKYNKYSYKNQLLDVLPSLMGCLIMGIPVYMINYLNLNNIITLIIQIILGVMIYILYSIVFKVEEFEICKTFIFKFVKMQED